MGEIRSRVSSYIENCVVRVSYILVKLRSRSLVYIEKMVYCGSFMSVLRGVYGRVFGCGLFVHDEDYGLDRVYSCEMGGNVGEMVK